MGGERGVERVEWREGSEESGGGGRGVEGEREGGGKVGAGRGVEGGREGRGRGKEWEWRGREKVGGRWGEGGEWREGGGGREGEGGGGRGGEGVESGGGGRGRNESGRGRGGGGTGVEGEGGEGGEGRGREGRGREGRGLTRRLNNNMSSLSSKTNAFKSLNAIELSMYFNALFPLALICGKPRDDEVIWRLGSERGHGLPRTSIMMGPHTSYLNRWRLS